MRKLGWIVGVGAWLCCGGTAEAAWTDWPVVSQALKVGSCLLADAGKITTVVTTHAAGAVSEVLLIVRDCITYTVDVVTPGGDVPLLSPPGAEEPHE